MGIDWFTFAAQIVNFLILMGLLWRFLYRPIMRAMSNREQRITDRLETADRKQREADREAQSYREKSQDLDNRRQELLAEAKEEAEQHRKRLIDDVRSEVEDKKRQWLKSMEEEKEDFFRELHRRLQRQLASTLGRILEDLADESLESRIVEAFVRRLENAQEEEEALNKLVQASDGTIEVVTAFELSNDHRDRIASAVQTKTQDGLEMKFARSDELVCGVELRFDGRKIGWSVDTYLQDLEADLAQAFQEQTKPDRPDETPGPHEGREEDQQQQEADESEAEDERGEVKQ